MFFLLQFNLLTPITLCSFGTVFLADDYVLILNKQMAPKVVTLHKIYDPYVFKNQEPAIMAKMNHPIIVSLEGRGRLC